MEEWELNPPDGPNGKGGLISLEEMDRRRKLWGEPTSGELIAREERERANVTFILIGVGLVLIVLLAISA